MAKFKSLLGLLGVSGPVSLSVYYGFPWGSEIVIFNFDGSSSMKSLMEFMLNDYKSDDGKKTSFNIASIGSSSGLKKLLNGDSEFALVSYDVSNIRNSDAYKEKWKARKLKTISIAKEGIVVLYKPPEKCNKDLVLSSSNVIKFYSLMSGYKYEGITENELDFSHLLEGDSLENCKVKVHPWVKSTGPLKSGTVKAFMDNPLLNKACENDKGNGKCETWKKNIVSGYGTDYSVNYVPESTNLHWDNFRNNLRDGAITYLPSHFVLQNWDHIQNLNIKFAQYKGSDDSVFCWSQDVSTNDSCEWKRTFNIIYSTENLNDRKKKLLEFFKQQKDKLEGFKILGVDNSSIDLQSPDIST